MGALLTAGWLAQPLAIPQLRPEYAAVASVCVVGDGNTNIAPVTSANRIVPAVSVTRVGGPAGGGWRSDGTAAPYRNVGKLQKFRGPQGLTLVCVFSGTDTSAIQWLAGTLDTGSNYVEDLACNREHTTGAHSAGRLSCQIRDDGSATPTQYSSTAATTFFDGKPHCIVLQWTVATPASLPVARMWVDGIAVALSTNGSGEAFSQAAGLTEFDYYTNTRNLRGTPSASINGVEYLFARLMSAQFDGKSLSANPWQMFEAPELDLYIPDAGGAYSLAMSESATAVDATSAALIANAAIAEAMAAADATLAAMIAAVSAAESITATDTPAAAMTASVTVSESASLTDAMNGSVGILTGSVVESLTLTDAPTVTLTAAVALAEAVTLLDALTGSGSQVWTSALVEAASASDAWAATVAGGVLLNARARAAGSITESNRRPTAATPRRPTHRS